MHLENFTKLIIPLLARILSLSAFQIHSRKFETSSLSVETAPTARKAQFSLQTE